MDRLMSMRSGPAFSPHWRVSCCCLFPWLPSLAAVPPRMGGAAGAVVQTGQRIGSALGAAVLVTAYQVGRAGGPMAGLEVTLAVSLAILLVALAAAYWDFRKGN